MANWIGTITNVGNSLLNAWVAGKNLNFDEAMAGTGTVAEVALMAQTSLTNPKQKVGIVGAERVNTGYRLKLQVQAADEGYVLNQIGVWASLTDEGPVMLALFQNSMGVPIPSKAETPDFLYTFYALVMCSNTGEWTVNIDTSALVTQGDLTGAVEAIAAAKQDKIMVDGILKGDGNGNITAATPGEDYAWPVATGQGAPTKETQGEVTQHYIDTETGKEYVCKGKDDDGYIWELAGATDAADLTYGDKNLAEALDDMAGRLSDVEDAASGSKTLTGHGDPTTATVGEVNQMYVNLDTGAMFICTGVEDGKYIWMSTGGGGAVLPRIVVNVTAGSAVTCTNGDVTLKASAVGGKAEFDVPDYGDWTVQATLDGQTSTAVTVTVDAVKQYTATLSYFSATLTVTAEANAQVTASDGTNEYTGTCGSNGEAALSVKFAGNYTVKATKEGVTSNSVTVNVATSGASYTATVAFITLTVTIDSGSSVTVSNDSTTKTGTSTGTVKFYLPNTGTWSVTASLNGETATGSVACSAYQGYSLELSYVKVFGVQWDSSNSSTALTRLKKASDPSGLVNVDITTEPSPAIGTGAGSSPFDNYLPWSGMEEYNIVDGDVTYKQGQSGFSRTGADTMVYIPEFYFQVVWDGTKTRFYIADKAKAGFTKHPGSGKYLGRYHFISGYYSKSGAKPLVSIDRPTARNGAKAKGSKYGLYDYATYCAVNLLYLIEFADWNCQSKIGQGWNGGQSVTQATGQTDSMTYHTGTSGSSRTVAAACQYRHIEELWGNVRDWVDGANFTERAAYICTTPTNYADDTTTNYTAAGVTLPSSGWIKNLGHSSAFPWAFLPSETGGSETTYVPNYVYSGTGWRAFNVGGYYYATAGYCGLWCFYAVDASSDTYGALGGRPLVHP